MSSPKKQKAQAKNDRRKKAKTDGQDGAAEMQMESTNPFPVKLKRTEKGYALGYNIVYVSNMDRSFKFYSELFGLKVRGKEKMGKWCAFDTGTTAFALNEIEKKDGRAAPSGPVQGTSNGSWFVPDVKAFHTHAKEVGAECVREPEKQMWGGMTSSYRDPDGALIEICEAPIDHIDE